MKSTVLYIYMQVFKTNVACGVQRTAENIAVRHKDLFLDSVVYNECCTTLEAINGQEHHIVMV